MQHENSQPQQPEHLPPGWVNPRPERRYDLAVIGGTRAGVAAARYGTEQGARVALIVRELRYEDNRIGWLPGSTWAEASRRWQRDLDRELPLWELLGYGIDVFFGRPCFTGPRTLQVDGASIEFGRAVLAVHPEASSSACADLMGDTSEALTPAAVSRIESLPRRVLVVGDTSQACEIAQAFCRLGSEVHQVVDLAGILPRADRRAAEWLLERLLADGVRVHRGWKIAGCSRSGRWTSIVLEQHGQRQELIAELVVDARDRPPSLASLDLVAAGIGSGPSGIRIDRRLRTSNRAIIAQGPAAGLEFDAGAAAAAGRLAARNALSMRSQAMDPLLPSSVVNTDPQLAQIGLNLAQADVLHQPVDSRWVELVDPDAGHCDRRCGLASLHLASGGRRLLGASIVAPQAATLAAELAARSSGGRSLKSLADGRFLSAAHGQAMQQIIAACRAARV